MLDKLTPEQKQSAKLQKEFDKYKDYCAESHLYTQIPYHMDDFNKLIELTEQMKIIKQEIKELREKIKSDMLECKCKRAINLWYKKQLTISSGGGTYLKKDFDVERFKKENPELYKRYCINYSQRNFSNGTLVLKDLTKKAVKAYKNPELSKYFISKYPDVPKDFKNKIFTIEEFRQYIKDGVITSYSGLGHYWDEIKQEQSNEIVHLYQILNGEYPKQYHYVIWHNN